MYGKCSLIGSAEHAKDEICLKEKRVIRFFVEIGLSYENLKAVCKIIIILRCAYKERDKQLIGFGEVDRFGWMIQREPTVLIQCNAQHCMFMVLSPINALNQSS